MFENIQKYFEGSASLKECLANNQAVIERDLAIATCVILVEVAASDQAIAPEEGDVITDLVHKKFAIPKSEIPILMRQAVQARKETGRLGQFIELVAEHFSQEQKETVIYMVWRMVLADGHIDANEEKLVDRLAGFLKINREQSLEAYQKAIDQQSLS